MQRLSLEGDLHSVASGKSGGARHVHLRDAIGDLLEDYSRPYVLTWGVDPARRHPSIGFDNRGANYALTQYLLRLGHRRFGLLSAPTAVIASNDVFAVGAMTACRAAGVRIR